MRLTDDIIKALHVCIEEGYESVADFAKNANVSANTISKYMRKESQNIQRDTWSKIYPLIKGYLQGKSSRKQDLELNSDQKILLDAFNELPTDVQDQKLLEIVSLAKKYIRERNHSESKKR